jgi:hypothetical protein
MANAVFHGDPKSLHSFAEFYPYYLNEHNNRTCRKLHFIGSTLALVCLWSLIWTREPLFFVAALVCGYGFAWIGHYGFEKNSPASFKRPLWSFMGDWRMYADIWAGKISM